MFKRLTLVLSLLVLAVSLVVTSNDVKSHNSPSSDYGSMLNQTIKQTLSDLNISLDSISKELDLDKEVLRIKLDDAILERNSTEDVLERAKTSLSKRKAQIELANQYNINFSEQDINEFIKKESEFHLTDPSGKNLVENLADGFGLTIDEFLYDWEYDNFLQIFLWREILPHLQKELPMNKEEEEYEYHIRISEFYNDKINSLVKEAS